MKQVFNKLIGLKISRREPASASKSAMSVPAENVDSRPHTIDDNSDNGTRRQLVQVVMVQSVELVLMAPMD